MLSSESFVTTPISIPLLTNPLIKILSGVTCTNEEVALFELRNASNSEQLNNLIMDKDWLPNERLRLQFLGYVWNEYLLHGYFDNLPSDILLKIENIIKIER